MIRTFVCFLLTLLPVFALGQSTVDPATDYHQVRAGAAGGSYGADFRFGGQISLADDFGFGIGARAVYDIDKFEHGIEIVATFDYFFGDGDLDLPEDADLDTLDVSYFEVNVNAVYAFDIGQQFLPYAGGGINYARTSGDYEIFGGGIKISEDEIGLNVLGGVKFVTSGPFTPFAEVRFELDGGGQVVVTGGVVF